MNLKFLKTQRGQTVTEYIMMISVSVLIGITVFNKLSDHFLKNPNSFVNRQLNQFQKNLSTSGGDRYQRFPLKLPR